MRIEDARIGQIVIGPFDSDDDHYGDGVGRVIGTHKNVRSARSYIDVNVLHGDRNRGGYAPASLRVLYGPIKFEVIWLED